MMLIAMTCVSLLCAGAAGAGQTPSAIEMKPLAISMAGPLEKEVQRSCVLRRRDGGAMRVVSASAGDPALGVAVREDKSAGTHVVTVTLPAGYQTSPQRPVDVLVRWSPIPIGDPSVDDSDRHSGMRNGIRPNMRPGSDSGPSVADQPPIRIPVRVWTGPDHHDPGWLTAAKSLIGKPMPKITAERLKGGQIDIGPVEGKVTVLVFSAYWCDHCHVHLPALVSVWKDHADRNVQFLGVAPGPAESQIVSSAKQWGLDWPMARDRNFEMARQFGVKAYPVVFLIGYDGTIEAVHGRRSNNATDNGLDNLETELRIELDILLTGRNRFDLPNWDLQSPAPIATTRPATTRPAVARPLSRVRGRAALLPDRRFEGPRLQAGDIENPGEAQGGFVN